MALLSCPAPGMKGANKIRKQTREEAGAGQAALQESYLVTCRARRPLLPCLDEVLRASPHSSLQQEAAGAGKREPDWVGSAEEPGSRWGSLTPLLFNEPAHHASPQTRPLEEQLEPAVYAKGKETLPGELLKLFRP